MSTTGFTYRDYTDDAAYMGIDREYYEKKYAGTLRESDKKLIELVRRQVGDGKGKRLLDMGCGQGGLLLHLRQAFPEMKMEGADLSAACIEANKASKDLKGIDFRVQDMLDMKKVEQRWDVVVSNAALMFFDDAEFARSVENLAHVVAPGGSFVAFDYFQPFDEQLTIVETSEMHPRGLRLTFRSYKQTRQVFAKNGLGEPAFEAWNMPFDLAKPTEPTDLTSYTVKKDDGERLSFRGSLFQPWCHVVARKA